MIWLYLHRKLEKKRFKYYSNNPERCFRKQNTKYIFTVVLFFKYGCESWTIKKADHQGINAFELWYWRRLLRVPGTSRSSNQSNLKEINPEYSLEGLIIKLKFQYFGHVMWRANSLEKILMLGRIEGRRRRGWQRMRWLDGITDSMHMSLSKLGRLVRDREALHIAFHGVTKSRTQLSDWTTTILQVKSRYLYLVNCLCTATINFLLKELFYSRWIFCLETP